MRRKIVDIYYVWVHELRFVLRDPAAILIFFIVPAIYPLLYATVYNKEVVSEVPVVVVDDSRSALSRRFVRDMDASHDVQIIGLTANMDEAREKMARKEAYGVLYISGDFSRDINRGEQTGVQIFSDMSAILHYKALLLAATEASLRMGAEIRVQEMPSVTREQDETAMQFVQGEWISMYNVPNGFAAFFIPAILILVIQQTMLLGICTLTGTHGDRRSMRQASWARPGNNVGAHILTLGKALCYASLYLLICVWVMRVVPWLFGLPQIGNPLTLAVFTMPFLMACTFFCLTLSYMCSERETGMLLFAATSVMFVFLSGVSWPWNAMPGSLKAIAYLIPSTPAIQGFVKINTMGASLYGVMPQFIALWIQAAAYWLGATLMYKWWLKRFA